jgi:hypothetical protein
MESLSNLGGLADTVAAFFFPFVASPMESTAVVLAIGSLTIRGSGVMELTLAVTASAAAPWLQSDLEGAANTVKLLCSAPTSTA